MNTAVFDVQEFHEAFNRPIGDPQKPDLTTDTQLRYELIREEFQELTEALEGQGLTKEEQLIKVADALGDILYVTIGAAVTWGIDIALVWDAIHKSNMTKTGGGNREDGKVLKGPNYIPPDIAGALAQAAQLCNSTGYGDEGAWPTPTAIKAMKSIPKTENFISNSDTLARLELGEFQEPRDTKPTPLEDHKIPYNGVFLKRGVFLFDCPCDRSHDVSLNMGSRGGRAKSAEVTCICGKVYTITFFIHNGEEWAEFQVTDLGGHK